MEVKKIMRLKTLIAVVVVVLIVFASYFVGKFSLELIGGSKYKAPSTLSESNRESSLNTKEKGSEPTFTVVGQAPYGSVVSTTAPGTSFGLKIIKNANLNMYVDKGKFLETYNRISSMIETYGGSVINSNYSKENDIFSGFIEVIVPKEKFDSVINKLGELGNVTNLEISSSDVTQEYVDLNSRLKVLEAQKELLTSWLKQAKTIDELLKIRSEIEQVESEIEQIKGRLNYIALNTDFSKVDIYLKEGVPEKTSHGTIFDKIKDYLMVPVNAFIYSIVGLLVIVAFLIPWALLGFGIYSVVRKIKAKS